MKRIVTFFLAVIICSASVVRAQDVHINTQIITSIYEPYSYLEDGAAQGIAVNEARKILAELNYYPPINVYPWARAYSTALHSPNAALFPVARTPEREDLFHWVGEIVDFNVYLFRAKKREDVTPADLSQLNQYTIGALRKDVKGEYLRKHGLEVSDLTSEETGIKLLLAGRLDLMPADINATRHRLQKLGLPEDAVVPAFHLTEISRPLYIALSKQTPPEVVEAFRAAYARAFPKAATSYTD